ncbi:UNVERIFIED_CONTAM: hypothetical protein RMT77_007391 [Armadillidium vulgare]
MAMNEPKFTKPSPYDNASFVSRLSFWWLFPFLKKGCQKVIDEDDLYNVPTSDTSLELGNLICSNWDDEILQAKESGRKASFTKALFRSFGRSFMIYGLLGFLGECVCRVAQPLFMIGVIRHFGGDVHTTWSTAMICGVMIVVMSALHIFVYHPFNFKCRHLVLKIKSAIGTAVYRKALRLSTKAAKDTTVGQMVNLLSNDINRFEASIPFAHFIWIGPLQTIISTSILWYEIGPSCLAGIFLLILYIPMQVFMGKIFSKYRRKTAQQTDERIQLISEVVNVMKVIKMYTWERAFTKHIEDARWLELKKILRANFFRALNMTLFFTSSKIIVFLSLLVFVLTGNEMTAEKVFVTTSLINNLRLTMTLHFPMAVSMGSETLASCKRIQRFLEMEEREESNKVVLSTRRPNPEECFVKASSVYARWNSASKEDDLHNISFTVKRGEVLTVVGHVGAGKSSLLQAILRELPLRKGMIKVQGKLAYASQEPWIFSGSIRDNILFGQPFIKGRYTEIIRVCALQKDMNNFPNSDFTLVGERGIALSGGQKARINLARALYYDADIYLLDDPFSAVDAHVGRHLYEECVSSFLKDKVTIITTHQLQFVKHANHILGLKNGREEHSGKTVDYKVQDDKLTEKNLDSKTTLIDYEEKKDSKDKKEKLSQEFLADLVKRSVLKSKDEDLKLKKDVGKETRSQGAVTWRTYSKFFSAGGGFVSFVFLIFANLTSQGFFSATDYFLSVWTDKEQVLRELSRNHSLQIEELRKTQYFFKDVVFVSEERNQFIYIYSGLTVALLILSFWRSFSHFYICNMSSSNLHRNMLNSIMKAPMNFFETYPAGQILNRFSKDVGQIDDQLPTTMHDYILIMFNFLGIIAVIAFLNFWTLVPTLVLYVLFLGMRWIYLSTSRDLKRLEGITRSPVFTHLSSTFAGLTTVRAFGRQNEFCDQFDKHQDRHSSAWFLYLSSTRLFGVYLDVLSTIYIAFVTFSFLFKEEVLSGEVGLAISLAMMLSGMFQWGVRQSAEVENQMTSVERILEYTNIKPEANGEIKTVEMPKIWPSRGEISFENVFLCYREGDPPVLKNLNFTINPAEKIGIVGRTGAGKSSILACLFRLTQPQGYIKIDNVSTDTLQLEDLRKSISIIPQDPALISGSVRRNVDPFEEYKDEEIWNALEEVHLKNAVLQMPFGLYSKINEGGSNLSVGQRQLVCLARAILKKNKILVMDEPTSNVDAVTDSLVQNTLRIKFSDCTVLTIAHRINSIMNSDKVMVMDGGKLVEFASPHDLLKNENSTFALLVSQLGNSPQLVKKESNEVQEHKIEKTHKN